MRAPVAMGLLWTGGYLLGHWWLDDAAPDRAPVHRSALAAPAAHRLGPAAPGRAAAVARVARPPVARTGDEVLEAMMIGHRDAMLLLREAIHHQLFYRGSPLAACGDAVADHVVCWVRLETTLHGPWMELEAERVECGGPRDGVLEACIRDRLTPGDPLGIPAEAADELGDYHGPIELPLTWDPA